jgi:hypothetical protein
MGKTMTLWRAAKTMTRMTRIMRWEMMKSRKRKLRSKVTVMRMMMMMTVLHTRRKSFRSSNSVVAETQRQFKRQRNNKGDLKQMGIERTNSGS